MGWEPSSVDAVEGLCSGRAITWRTKLAWSWSSVRCRRLWYDARERRSANSETVDEKEDDFILIDGLRRGDDVGWHVYRGPLECSYDASEYRSLLLCRWLVVGAFFKADGLLD